jgi:antitoxin PrlF
MPKAKITYKGQVTIPKEIRESLSIHEGDSVFFSIEADHAILKPLRKKALTDFRGALPATKPYAGMGEIRSEIHKKMARRVKKDESK